MNKVLFLKPSADGMWVSISSTQRTDMLIRFTYNLKGGYHEPASVWESHSYEQSN